MFAEFAAHDSRLRFRSLNDVQGSAINLHQPLAKPLDLIAVDRNGLTDCQSEANDPQGTLAS
jgi:hypothetical protein